MAKKSASEQQTETPQPADRAEGKKGPTPKRREAEAAHFRPLVPEDRKAARQQAQAKMRTEQAKAREGMARGDDRYLRPNERGPQKRFLRDFIDARITLGEWIIPLMFLVLFSSFLGGQVQVIAMMFIWVYVLLAVVESIIYGRIIRNRVKAVVGESRTEKGFAMQTLSRSMQLRMLRMPKPQVKRFQTVVFTNH